MSRQFPWGNGDIVLGLDDLFGAAQPVKTWRFLSEPEFSVPDLDVNDEFTYQSRLGKMQLSVPAWRYRSGPRWS